MTSPTSIEAHLIAEAAEEEIARSGAKNSTGSKQL
jgi:hypothetical protein